MGRNFDSTRRVDRRYGSLTSGALLIVGLGAVACKGGVTGNDAKEEPDCPETCAPGTLCVGGQCLAPCDGRTDCGPLQACLDGACKDNPYLDCAQIPACPLSSTCVESDGTADAFCAPIACTGVGRGSCPNAALECVAGNCALLRAASGLTLAGGVAVGMASTGYRLDAVLSPPEGQTADASRYATSANYRLETGLTP